MPLVRIEHTTFSLQERCSTTELKRLADFTLLFKIHIRALNSFYPINKKLDKDVPKGQRSLYTAGCLELITEL
jgi:hypothetical protein